MAIVVECTPSGERALATFRKSSFCNTQYAPYTLTAHPNTLHYDPVHQSNGYTLPELSAELHTSPVPSENLHINRMWVIPKGHSPGKWRLITDLSFPGKGSVNEGIDESVCTLQYTSVGWIAVVARALGARALMAKLDVQSMYCLLPVLCTLLSIQWRGELFVDGMLPFGLRSAPKIFTGVADSLEWVLRQRGVQHVDHHLDVMSWGCRRPWASWKVHPHGLLSCVSKYIQRMEYCASHRRSWPVLM